MNTEVGCCYTGKRVSGKESKDLPGSTTRVIDFRDRGLEVAPVGHVPSTSRLVDMVVREHTVVMSDLDSMSPQDRAMEGQWRAVMRIIG